MAADPFLHIVKDDWLVEQIELSCFWRQPFQLPPRAAACLWNWTGIVWLGLDLVTVHRCTTEKPGLLISVIGDHLEIQANGLAIVGQEGRQEPGLVAQPGSPDDRAVRERCQLHQSPD